MTLTVDKQGEGVRTDAYLSSATGMSRTAAARLCEEGQVTRNGKPAAKRDLLREGDRLDWCEAEPAPSKAVAQNIPLDIIWEDADLLVINKPAGMVVHPAAGNPDGTLVNALLYHCGSELSGIGGELRPGIVHRIDKDTGGLLVVAKNDFTHRALSEQLAYHGVRRVYRALCRGGFREPEGTVNAPIGRHPTDRKKMAVIRDGIHTAKEAVTHYRVLRDYGGISYLELRLETGRTHQIRVHMASVGHPLLGDTLYGGGHTPFERAHADLLHGQCLFACELSFVHPRTGETVSFSCPLPDDFTHLLTILENQNR